MKLSAGPFYGDAKKDQGFQTSEDARFYAYSTKFPKFSNEGKDLVIQFQVRFPQKIDCGGGYIKVFGSDIDPKSFSGDSKYNVMFGPDVCGTSTKKVHVIFRHPVSDKNLLIKKEISAETDQLSHVYTLIVRPDNTYEVRVDGNKKESGSMYSDWDLEEPKEIPDPAASKPADWVDSPKMDDPSDQKPANWDDTPKQIPDPDAKKPDDWDEESDGKWEAPTIANPEWKGEWKAKQIDNPKYKGPWVHPKVANPKYVHLEDVYKYTDFAGVGIDVWQVKSGTIFDNIIITDSVADAEAFLNDTFKATKDAEKKMFDDAEKAKADEEAEKRKASESSKKETKEDEEEDEEDAEDELDEKIAKGHEEL